MTRWCSQQRPAVDLHQLQHRLLDYGGSSGFQPGSTYKVFTLAEWLNDGHSLRESFDGRKRAFTRFTDSCVGNWSGSYEPRNDDGRIASNAINATKWSVNSGFMAMATQLDLCKIKQTAEAFLVHRADGEPLEMNPGDVLGSQVVAPITMATAFAGIANGGLTCSPIVIDRILDRSGVEVPPPKTTCRQSVEPSVAAAMAYAMKETFSGDGTAVASNTGSGVPHIGKTGTTDSAKDTWMIGASTAAATAVWVGNVNYDANLRELRFESGPAATARHRIWPRIMANADARWGGAAFAEPDDSAFRVVQADIPDVRGKTLDEARSMIENAGFGTADAGPQDSELPAGQVSATNPSGSAPRGSVVGVHTSNGSLVLMPDCGRHAGEGCACRALRVRGRVGGPGCHRPSAERRCDRELSGGRHPDQGRQRGDHHGGEAPVAQAMSSWPTVRARLIASMRERAPNATKESER